MFDQTRVKLSLKRKARQLWESENPYHHAIAKYHYNPKTGILTNKRTGKANTTPNKTGYIMTSFTSEYTTGVHRIAFLIMEKRWPKIIDHINHNKADNRWCNLREVDHCGNAQNRTYKTSQTGIVGVNKHDNGYVAHISVGGKQKSLGYFTTLIEAAIARLDAEIKNNYLTGNYKSSAYYYVKEQVRLAETPTLGVEA